MMDPEIQLKTVEDAVKSLRLIQSSSIHPKQKKSLTAAMVRIIKETLDELVGTTPND